MIPGKLYIIGGQAALHSSIDFTRNFPLEFLHKGDIVMYVKPVGEILFGELGSMIQILFRNKIGFIFAARISSIYNIDEISKSGISD